MRLIFIRHAEPDYEHDSLTEKGWREAKLLAVRTKSWQVDDFYVSPLGRAQDTASFTLKAHGKTAEVMDWLHEFQGALPDGTGGTRLCWDLMPDAWTAQPELLQPTGWENAPILQGTNVKAEYDRVTAGLDALLASYGYTRHGDIIPAGNLMKKRSSASVTLALQRFCCPICGTSARLPCCTVRFLLRHP